MIHLTSIVLVASAAPAWLAWAGRHHLPGAASVVLWHTACAGALVALAASGPLAAQTTGLMGKTALGSIRPLNAALMWPYHAALRAKLGLQRALSSEPIWDAVTDGLYIGGWWNIEYPICRPSDASRMPAGNPAVLDVTCELPLRVQAPAYLCLPTWDTHCPTVEQMDWGVEWALGQLSRGRPVLVHCAHGHGRSAAVVAAVLVARGLAGDVAGAEALMRAVRPGVKLNARQRAGAEAWVARHAKRGA